MEAVPMYDDDDAPTSTWDVPEQTPLPKLKAPQNVYWCLKGHRNVKKNPQRFRCTTCGEKTLVKEHPKRRAVDYMCT